MTLSCLGPAVSWSCQLSPPAPESLTSAPSPTNTVPPTASYKLPQILLPLSFQAPELLGGARPLSISTLLLPLTPYPSSLWPRAPLTYICWGSSDFHISMSGAACQSLSSLTSLRHQKPLNIFLPRLGALSFPRSPAGCSPHTGLLSVSSLDFLNSHVM